VADGIVPPPIQPSRGTKREAPVDVPESEDYNNETGLDIDDEALRELNALKVRSFLWCAYGSADALYEGTSEKARGKNIHYPQYQEGKNRVQWHHAESVRR
jgi:hypothetical protein